MSCLGFVFVAILEFAIVLWIPSIMNLIIKDSAETEDVLTAKPRVFVLNSSKILTDTNNMDADRIKEKKIILSENYRNVIDNLSYFSFGIFFVLYNVYYWAST